MTIRTVTIVATPLLAVLPAAGPAPLRTPDCRDVAGSIEAHVSRVRPRLTGLGFDGTGTSNGDLHGDVEVSAFKRYGAKELRLRVRIATPTGVVEMSGRAVLESAPDQPDTHSIAGTWTVAGQTGMTRGTAGVVVGSGVADTRARSARIGYSGQICEEMHVVDANPRVARGEVQKRLAGSA